MYTGRVYWYKARPRYSWLIGGTVILIAGTSLSVYYRHHALPGDLDMKSQSAILAGATIVLTGICYIIGTARLWFSSLNSKSR